MTAQEKGMPEATPWGCRYMAIDWCNKCGRNHQEKGITNVAELVSRLRLMGSGTTYEADTALEAMAAQLVEARELARDNENWFNALKADFDKAQKDAARYRYLRNTDMWAKFASDGFTGTLVRGVRCGNYLNGNAVNADWLLGPELDAAIDAALGIE